jgi:hypothetical protein
MNDRRIPVDPVWSNLPTTKEHLVSNDSIILKPITDRDEAQLTPMAPTNENCQKQDRRATVKFSKKPEYFYIETLKEISGKDKSLIWFSHLDFKAMETETQVLLSAIEAGRPLRRDQTLRGLEKLLADAAMDYFSLRHETVNAVLNEQEYQRSYIRKKYGDSSNRDEIARAYQQVSYIPRIRASEQGQQDFDDIQRYLLRDPSCQRDAVRMSQLAEEKNTATRKLKRKNILLSTTSKLFGGTKVQCRLNKNITEEEIVKRISDSSSESGSKSSMWRKLRLKILSSSN